MVWGVERMLFNGILIFYFNFEKVFLEVGMICGYCWEIEDILFSGIRILRVVGKRVWDFEEYRIFGVGEFLFIVWIEFWLFVMGLMLFVEMLGEVVFFVEFKSLLEEMEW